MNDQYKKGTYGYDVAFFRHNSIPVVELKDEGSAAAVMIVPDFQGRVITSTAGGLQGSSFGWINYDLIASGEVNDHFNPYGGEERLWLGPEGGPFSIYFKPGAAQDFDGWKVPALIDTEPFELVEQSAQHVRFTRDARLTNASGTALSLRIERKVSILPRKGSEEALGLSVDPNLSMVAYESENKLFNTGTTAWNEQTGVLSIWMLSMFNPSEDGVVVIPFNTGAEGALGPVVNDDYFGKVPADRLLRHDGVLFFKTDGKHRSKIGLSPMRAQSWCGSYDPVQNVLTLLWYSLPENPERYVNSKWGPQDDPLNGDALNSYNDGPLEDGSVMGPFYEIESSSPAAFLSPGASITHTQRIFHITGREQALDNITTSLFGLTTEEIKNAF